MILHAYRYPRDPAKTPPSDRARAKLLLLHGMGGNGSLWRPVAANLEDHADLLCPDQRGHGQSLVPGDTAIEEFGPLAYGADLRDTCEAADFVPAWVIGHSMGVRSACGYAKLAPDAVSGLVLVDLGFSGVAGGG